MQLPESVQRFLRRTAVLDQLCAPLCDALVGESGAQEQLRRLEASNSFLIPLDRRARVVPLPRTVPRVPAWRASSSRARDRAEAASASRRLVRVPRLPALALEHLLHTSEQDRCVRLVTAAGAADLQCRPDLDRAAVALRARRLRHRGVPAAGRAGRVDRGVDRADHRSATVGGDHRRRFLRPGARGRHGVVRLRTGHAASRHVCSGPRADDGRRKLRGGTGAAVELVARHRAPHVRRGTFAHRRRGPGVCPVRGSVHRRGDDSATPTRSSTARPSSRWWRWIAGDGPRRPNTSN